MTIGGFQRALREWFQSGKHCLLFCSRQPSRETHDDKSGQLSRQAAPAKLAFVALGP